MNIVVTMAGSSEEFYKDGSSYTKFLVEIGNKTMVEHVVESLNSLLNKGNNVIFLIRKEDDEKYHLGNVIRLLVPEVRIVIVGDNVSGAAITSLFAIEHIIKEDPLILINGDQIIDIEHQDIARNFTLSGMDAGVVVFESFHPRWSFVKCSDNGLVIEAAEKKQISSLATAGLYYYKRAEEYIKCTKNMILKDNNVNGKFYICPVFNEMILDGKKIITYKIDSDKYHSLMSPKKVKQYEIFLN